MNKLYVFDTEEEAITCERSCYDTIMETATNPLYKGSTTKWCEIRQREDEKWTVDYCEDYGNPENYIIEETE